ncbi:MULTISPECIES: alternative tryptophan synthase beta-subunit [Microbacterium]|uniref:alternative tryptophan synthase beta-subunit n=1 Tax=Microbacterium TaxID=33882 RepID=UPI000D360941|nr:MULTISPECIES: alternative tryptophan synthase beta-subunit [Microbacterium]PTT16396.1 alternative tryptophan synthase beta-subunit [Microbacterium sp. HMWF026]
MTRPRTVTHTYTLAGGWQRAPHGPLTADLADELRRQGITMVRARRGLFDVREISLLNPPPARSGSAPRHG